MSPASGHKAADVGARFLIAWFFSASLALLFLDTSAHGMPWVETVLYSGIGLLAMSLLFWNRWCVLGTLAVLSISLFAFRKPIQEVLGPVAEFANWVGWHITGWQSMNADYAEPFQIAVCGAMSIGAWLTALRFRLPLPAFGIFLAVAGHAYFFGEPRLLAYTVPILSCLYLLSVQNSVRGRDQGKIAAPALPRSVLALTAFPLVFAIALLPLLALPKDTSRLRSVTVIGLVDDFTDFLNFDFGRRSVAREAFSISQFGYYPDDGRLGGTISPSSQPVLSVTASKPALLRGTILDTYIGDRWIKNAGADEHRLDGLFSIQQEAQDFAFNLDLPDAGKWPADQTEGRFHDTLTFGIRMLTNTGSVMFTPGRVLALDADGGTSLYPYFNDAGELFVQRSLRVRDTYRVDSRVLRTGDPNFGAFVSTVNAEYREGNADQPDAVPAGMDADYWQACLELPASLPDSVRETAAAITAGIDDPYDKAQAIRAFFQIGFVYSLTVTEVPKDRDFVEWFLETKEGYCTYYASAMTVLARCAGIPARYVEGFSMDVSDTATRELGNGLLEFRITGKDAHAWSEIYIQGAGWIPIDATRSGSGSEVTPPPEDDVTPGPDPITETPVETSPMPTRVPSAGDAFFDTATMRLALILVFSAAIAAAIVLLYRRRLHWFDVDRATSRLGSGASVMEAYWNTVTGMLSIIGYPSEPSDTSYGYVDRLTDENGGLSASAIGSGLRWLADRHVAVVYGGAEPTREDLLHAYGILTEVTRAYRDHRGHLRYYLLDLPLGLRHRK